MGLGTFGDQAVVSQRKYWLFNPLPVGGMGFEGFQCGGKFILGKIQVIVARLPVPAKGYLPCTGPWRVPFGDNVPGKR